MNTAYAFSNAKEFFGSRLEQLRSLAHSRPFWTTHLLPTTRGGPRLNFDPPAVQTSLSGVLVTDGDIRGRKCQDGYIVSETIGEQSVRHVLVFHDGKIEFYSTAYPGIPTDNKLLSWKRVFPDICMFLDRLLRIPGGTIPFPLDSHVALVDYQGYTLSEDAEQPISRDTIAGSPGTINADTVPESLFKLFFDKAFEECGQERCPAYLENSDFCGF